MSVIEEERSSKDKFESPTSLYIFQEATVNCFVSNSRTKAFRGKNNEIKSQSVSIFIFYVHSMDLIYPFVSKFIDFANNQLN